MFLDHSKKLLSGSTNGVVTIWCLETFKCEKYFTSGISKIYNLGSISPNSLISICGIPYQIKIFDMNNMKIYKDLRGHTKTVHNIKWCRSID